MDNQEIKRPESTWIHTDITGKCYDDFDNKAEYEEYYLKAHADAYFGYLEKTIEELKSKLAAKGETMTKTKIIIVDIDGTISDANNRANKYLGKNPDWDSFYNACGSDKPIEPVIELVESLSITYKVVFCSGRRESCRQDTEDWIDKYVHLYGTNRKPFTFLFRKDGDTRHDTIVKPEMLDKYLSEHPDEEVFCTIEDRNSMVEKWRELGYLCIQPATGDF